MIPTYESCVLNWAHELEGRRRMGTSWLAGGCKCWWICREGCRRKWMRRVETCCDIRGRVTKSERESWISRVRLNTAKTMRHLTCCCQCTQCPPPPTWPPEATASCVFCALLYQMDAHQVVVTLHAWPRVVMVTHRDQQHSCVCVCVCAYVCVGACACVVVKTLCWRAIRLVQTDGIRQVFCVPVVK